MHALIKYFKVTMLIIPYQPLIFIHYPSLDYTI